MILNSPSFKDFIEEKPLFYKEIDHKRVHKAYALLKPYINKPLTIHIVGTNGKGSTGRILATLLDDASKRVGHFSSPHILKFNERIWIEGEDISDEGLEDAHTFLYKTIGQEMSEALSYFEYTTLLALVAMQNLDVMVLEAGLGGEFDATNVISKDLTIVTPIGLDHQDFLGDTIEEIARTKINSVEKNTLLSLQNSPEVYTLAEEIVKKKEGTLERVDRLKDKYLEEVQEIFEITKKRAWTEYLFENTLTAVFALKILNLSYSLESLNTVQLFGRFYPLSSNITIDVGHNFLAAEAIVKALALKYQKKKIVLIYNALNDKDYVNILKLFKPYVKHIEIIRIETARAVEREKLVQCLNSLEIPFVPFQKVSSLEEYLVFGSFYVVEAFLNRTGQNINLY